MDIKKNWTVFGLLDNEFFNNVKIACVFGIMLNLLKFIQVKISEFKNCLFDFRKFGP